MGSLILKRGRASFTLTAMDNFDRTTTHRPLPWAIIALAAVVAAWVAINHYIPASGTYGDF